MKLKSLFLLIPFIVLIVTSCGKQELDELKEEIKPDTSLNEEYGKKSFGGGGGGDINPNNNPCDVDQLNLRILFIGNSFTANYTTDLPLMFENLALHNGQSITNITTRATSGFTLASHLGSINTVNAVNQGNWDYVILQENSGYLAAGNGAGFTSSVNSFVNLIDNNSPDAKVILFQVVPPVAAGTSTYNALQNSWNTLFANAASASNVYVCNVGQAFTDAYSGGSAAYGYNVTNPDELRYGSQFGFHFANPGGFLTAVSFYTLIFNNKPCIPATMDFYGGSGSVATIVPQYDELAQIGFMNSVYDLYGFVPITCRGGVFGVGQYPCK